MYAFTYSKPTSIADAGTAFSNADDATFMAGGQTLIPTLKQRLAMPSDVIDLGGIDEMKGICPDGDAIVIGAMTCHADVAASDDVQKMIPALASLAGGIGDPSVRNRGTIGGSVANNDPAADYPGAVVALKSKVKTSSREIDGDAFFTGMFETALEEGEMIVAIRFEKPDRAAYVKFPNPASRYAIVGAFVAVYGDEVRVAVTGAGACVFRAPDMETVLAQNFSADAVKGMSVAADDLNGDLHASPEYRASLVPVMVARAVTAAA